MEHRRAVDDGAEVDRELAVLDRHQHRGRRAVYQPSAVGDRRAVRGAASSRHRGLPKVAQVSRVCLTGPECTGKTGLARRLASEMGVPWVREFARSYAEECGNQLGASDVDSIARGQMANEDDAP